MQQVAIFLYVWLFNPRGNRYLYHFKQCTVQCVRKTVGSRICWLHGFMTDYRKIRNTKCTTKVFLLQVALCSHRPAGLGWCRHDRLQMRDLIKCKWCWPRDGDSGPSLPRPCDPRPRGSCCSAGPIINQDITAEAPVRCHSEVSLSAAAILSLSLSSVFLITATDDFCGLQLRHKCLLLRIIQQETIISIAIESKYS